MLNEFTDEFKFKKKDLMIFKQIQVDQNELTEFIKIWQRNWNELTDEFKWFDWWIQMIWLMNSNDLTDEIKLIDRWI